MSLSRSSSGVWYLFYRDELGKRRAVSTRTRLKSEALRYLRAFRIEDREGKANLQKISVSQFSKTYLLHSRSIHTPKTTEHHDVALTQFIRIVGDALLHRVTVRDAESFLAQKTGEARAWTARKYYIALSSAFGCARRWGHVEKNIWRDVPRPRTPELLPKYISRADFQRILKAIPDRDYCELVFVAATTGARRGELLALRWSSVDFLKRTVTIGGTGDFKTKTKQVRVVPMPRELHRMLSERKKLQAVETAQVFHEGGGPLSPDSVSKRFRKLCNTLGVIACCHSLRHSCCTWLAADGVSLFLISRLAGHASTSTTQVYSHAAASELHSTVDRLGVRLN